MHETTEKKTTTESIVLFQETLKGKNFSKESIRAYRSDLQQFFEWLKSRRVDWDIPHRIERIDIVQFINHLAEQKASAITRKRLTFPYGDFSEYACGLADGTP